MSGAQIPPLLQLVQNENTLPPRGVGNPTLLLSNTHLRDFYPKAT